MLGLPVLTPVRLRDPVTVADVCRASPGLGILADYGKLVPPAMLDLPGHGILNLHPSLLPRHRGATPIPAAILDGDAETGVTLFRMDAGLDTGPILASRGGRAGRRRGCAGAGGAPRDGRRGPARTSRLGHGSRDRFRQWRSRRRGRA